VPPVAVNRTAGCGVDSWVRPFIIIFFSSPSYLSPTYITYSSSVNMNHSRTCGIAQWLSDLVLTYQVGGSLALSMRFTSSTTTTSACDRQKRVCQPARQLVQSIVATFNLLVDVGDQLFDSQYWVLSVFGERWKGHEDTHLQHSIQ
jgi:hypothetical protein